MLYILEKCISCEKFVIGMMFGMIGMFILSLCVLLMKWKYVFVLKKYCVIVEFVLVFILCVKFLRLVFGECDCGWYFG